MTSVPTPPPSPLTLPAGAHGAPAPSAWVTRWLSDLAPGATVLDLACGSGRHVRWAAARGLAVCALDRDAAALAGLADQAETVLADIEQGPWPLEGRHFDAVIVTNYLWRPLWPRVLAAVRPGGRWIHETFGQEHARVGRPSNPDFLLEPGELLRVATGAGWRVRAYEDGWRDDPRRQIQRIVAEAPGSSGDAPWAL
jgi:SAM-dependent methyltransferase